MLKFTLAIFCEIFSLHISYQIDSYFELPSIKKLLVVFVQINRVWDRLAFLKTKGEILVFVVFVCKKSRQIQMRQILASFSQEMKNSSKQ